MHAHRLLYGFCESAIDNTLAAISVTPSPFRGMPADALTTELLPHQLRTKWLGVVYAAAQGLAFAMISLGGACRQPTASSAFFLSIGVVSAVCALVLALQLEETRPSQAAAPADASRSAV